MALSLFTLFPYGEENELHHVMRANVLHVKLIIVVMYFLHTSLVYNPTIIWKGPSAKCLFSCQLFTLILHLPILTTISQSIRPTH